MNFLTFLFLLLLLLVVYVFGLFLPIMESDSAQFYSMAMRMVLDENYLELYKGEDAYLDKPHLHFWLSALSFKLFGFTVWAYRLPAFIITLLGAYSVGKIAELIISKKLFIFRLAVLVFLSIQTIVLSNHDVRTDALLTGFTAFSLWQAIRYLETKSSQSVLLAALGMGLAFSVKGQLAVAVIGFISLVYIVVHEKWKALFNYKILVGVFVFFLTISPVLYAYYCQFDLHPELVIRGESGRSGIGFILLDQSFERLMGTNFGTSNNYYLFLFHSLLWLVLPWTVFFFSGWWKSIRWGSIENRKIAGLSWSFLALFLIFSLAQYKLPHYLNLLMPLAAVIITYAVVQVKIHKIVLLVHYLIISISLVLVIAFNLYAFSPVSFGVLVGLNLILLIGLVLIYSNREKKVKVIVSTIMVSVAINFMLNANFYKKLIPYQTGTQMALAIKEANLPIDEIHHYSKWYFGLDVAVRKNIPFVTVAEVKKKKLRKERVYVLVLEKELKEFEGLSYEKILQVKSYRVSQLRVSFLNPKTREDALFSVYLLKF